MEVDIDLGLRAGQDLADAGQRILAARHTDGGRIEAWHERKPWGEDSLGVNFSTGYAQAAAQILELWEAAARRTAELGAQVVAAVGGAVGTDAEAGGRLGKVLTPGPTPPTPATHPAPHPG